MTNRLEKIIEYVDRLIIKLPLPEKRYTKHLSGVSSSWALLAHNQGLDPELAAISGLLHDIYKYKTGINMYHSHNGAEMARVILKNMGDCFSQRERQIILSAIFHHSDKSNMHGHTKADKPENKRTQIADIAEMLLAAPIIGSRQDSSFMHLIRYWPEDSAFDELVNAWCAAFVYHCCQEAGFFLPIRWINEDRFAGVSAWNSWARKLGYFIKDEPGVIPMRGDIVLYRNLIPHEYRLEGQKDIPIDHIGIILASDSETYTVAEGNVNNQNVSGILTRPLNKNIEGYIRIDNLFNYDDWVFDYLDETYKI